MRRIAIVDDHKLFSAGLQLLVGAGNDWTQRQQKIECGQIRRKLIIGDENIVASERIATDCFYGAPLRNQADRQAGRPQHSGDHQRIGFVVFDQHGPLALEADGAPGARRNARCWRLTPSSGAGGPTGLNYPQITATPAWREATQRLCRTRRFSPSIQRHISSTDLFLP
jgi:hypothetical protein